MVKTCASGLCHNNNKKHPDKGFALFVHPKGRGADLERAKIWVQLSGRGNFVVENVTRQTYVCSDHFDENVVLDCCLVSIYRIKSA